MATFISERARSTLSLVSWRHLRGPADYRTLANIGQRCNLADHVDDVLTVEALANEMEHPSQFRPGEDVLIAEIEGRPVAWQLTQWRREMSATSICCGALSHPAGAAAASAASFYVAASSV